MHVSSRFAFQAQNSPGQQQEIAPQQMLPLPAAVPGAGAVPGSSPSVEVRRQPPLTAHRHPCCEQPPPGPSSPSFRVHLMSPVLLLTAWRFPSSVDMKSSVSGTVTALLLRHYGQKGALRVLWGWGQAQGRAPELLPLLTTAAPGCRERAQRSLLVPSEARPARRRVCSLHRNPIMIYSQAFKADSCKNPSTPGSLIYFLSRYFPACAPGQRLYKEATTTRGKPGFSPGGSHFVHRHCNPAGKVSRNSANQTNLKSTARESFCARFLNTAGY